MSIGSIYVQADDGKKYRNPVIEGDDWFICFDEDEPAELVIQATHSAPPVQILHDLGIKGELTMHGPSGQRMFKGEFHKAIAYWISLKAPIPAKAITKHEGTAY